jgi:hypothetical protein
MDPKFSRESSEPEWLIASTKLKQVTLERLATMPASERDIVSPPISWSASGIVEHLILTEECVAGIWKEKLRSNPNPRTDIKSALSSRMVAFIFSKTSLQVPTLSELEPTGGIGIDELVVRWDVARQRLRSALPDDEHAAWILHPAFGPLSSLQMGQLIRAHLEHHLRHWPTPTS